MNQKIPRVTTVVTAALALKPSQRQKLGPGVGRCHSPDHAFVWRNADFGVYIRRAVERFK